MSSYVTKKTPGDSCWFTQDKFGLFIHFGIYAMGGRYEWQKSFERTPEEKYDIYFKHFNPDMLDARDWARQAKAAGMKYAVLTTKHHDGFCLFDTKYTDYNVMNTPYGKDIIKEYADAFRAEGLHVGLYYSLIDWHHPDFPIDWLHPRAEDANAFELNQGRDMKKYAKYMRDQLEELMTNYGKIDILWCDFSYDRPESGKYGGFTIPDWMHGKGKDDWEAEELFNVVRKYQPHILINDRAGLEQDIVTPEQRMVTKWPSHNKTDELLVWETCQTLSGTWGYSRDELTWKDPRTLIEILINTACFGGNLIMNVGPTSRGFFDHRAEAALKVYAEWMKYNSRSIYGCTMAEPDIKEPKGCRLTQSKDGKRLYVHLMEYPFKFLELPGLGGRVEYAQFLHDGSEILINSNPTKTMALKYYTERAESENPLVLMIPVVKPNDVVPVIELFLKENDGSEDFAVSQEIF